MKAKMLSLLLMLLMHSTGIFCQDVHFTQYNMAPMSLNPALIGKFSGTVRVGGIFRGQWSSILGASQQFATPSAWLDAPVFQGIRKRDWIGLGLMLFNDKAGALGLTHGGMKLGGAYHLALNKKATAFLSVGYHFGGEQRKLSPGDRARFADGFKPNGDYGLSQEGLASEATQYNDNDAGIALSGKLNKRMDFLLGVSMYHLTRPNYSVLRDTSTGGGGSGNPGAATGNADIPRRLVASGTFNVILNDKLITSPSFLFQSMQGADEIAIQNLFSLMFNPKKEIVLKFGAGYRLRDAAQILLGFKQKDLNVGFAYDINISRLSSQTGFRGGFEIAANYIIKKYKKANPQPKIICPRF